MTATNMVRCPLGPDCLSNAVNHDVSSDEFAKCQARANGGSAAGKKSKADMKPKAYSPSSHRMRKLLYDVKRAFGSDGRGLPNLIGPPGIGKTEFARSLAERMDADFMVFDVSSKDPDCLSGIPYNPEERTEEERKRFEASPHVFLAGRLYDKDVVDIFYRDDRSDKPMLVFFDEINGGKEALLSSLQKVMTGRELPETGKKMNPNVLMMAAMNDADHTSNGNELAPAMVSRLTPIDFKPDFEDWSNGEMTFWGKEFDEEGIGITMGALGDTPPTKDQYLQAATHVVNYLDEMGFPYEESGSGNRDRANLFSMPPDEDDYNIKVGQPRSWSKAISGIASAMANPPPVDSPSGGEGVAKEATGSDFAAIVKANCGALAAQNFASYYEQHKDLPNINDAIQAGTLGDARFRWKKEGRADIPMFAMNSIASKSFERDLDGDVDRLMVAFDLMSEVAQEYPDLAASRYQKAVKDWTKQIVKYAEEQGSDTLRKEFNKKLAAKLTSDETLMAALGRNSSVDEAASGGSSAIDAAMGQAQKAVRAREEKLAKDQS